MRPTGRAAAGGWIARARLEPQLAFGDDGLARLQPFSMTTSSSTRWPSCHRCAARRSIVLDDEDELTVLAGLHRLAGTHHRLDSVVSAG